MPLYLLRMTLSHPTFRIPSLLSSAQIYGVPLKIISEEYQRGVLIIELEDPAHIHLILDRCITIVSASLLYAQAQSYVELQEVLQSKLQLFKEDMDKSFRITAEASNYHLPGTKQIEIAESFAYLALRGKVDLKHAEVEYLVHEDYDDQYMYTQEEKKARYGKFSRVYFAKRIGYSKARPLVNAFQVRERAYYGNTSMDSEMGFFMAAQTLPGPAKITYDPFVGTGSLLYACATWGSYVFGSDIDGRQIRGKGKGKHSTPGIVLAAQQYGIQDKFLDCLTFDVTKSPLRRGGWVDAIVTDPPYGVRAGAKRSGKKHLDKRPQLEEAYTLPDGTKSHEQPGYLPPFRPYELTHLTLDLIRLARYLLVPRGRLVFFLPTVTEEYDAIDVPVVEGMRELKWGKGSVQDFGKWSRRLITMEKTAEDIGEPPTFEDYEDVDGRLAGHLGFRDRYFEGFVPRSSADAPSEKT